MGSTSGIDLPSQGYAVFNAWGLAKVMMVAEDLKLGEWLKSRPLIYAVLQECLLFAMVFILFHILEKVVIGVMMR